MKNVWRGMILGAGIGFVLDVTRRVGHDTAHLAEAATQSLKERGPELAHRVRGKAAQTVRHAKNAIND